MRYLVLSDLHSNWDALQAVLKDAEGQYDLTVCCGDLVGYGPDPNRVLDWARANLHAVIRGNHDRACCGLEDLEWFNAIAQTATRWTIQKLTESNIEYLLNLPPGPLAIEQFLLIHGSPLDEDEYVVSMSDASNVFPYLEARIAFFGHTHLQGGFVWKQGEQVFLPKPIAPANCDRIALEKEAFGYLINPGSVGQPRDSDARAAYALFDSQTEVVLLRRVPYDFEAVRAKIEAAGLPPVLGERLGQGR